MKGKNETTKPRKTENVGVAGKEEHMKLSDPAWKKK